MACTCEYKTAGKNGTVRVLVKECDECKVKREEQNIIAIARKESEDARLFLISTDWKVIRHRDQVDNGLPTSLTDAEYQELLDARQEARGKVV